MKIVETKLTCKCGAVRDVRWFVSEELHWLAVESEVCCLKCSEVLDTTKTAKFQISDVDGYLIIWNESPV